MDNQHVEELGQIQGLLRSWGRPVPGAGADPAMRASMGMASDAELARLGTLRGPAFDQEWIRVMIRHHQGAIDMSRTLLAGPPRPGRRHLRRRARPRAAGPGGDDEPDRRRRVTPGISSLSVLS